MFFISESHCFLIFHRRKGEDEKRICLPNSHGFVADLLTNASIIFETVSFVDLFMGETLNTQTPLLVCLSSSLLNKSNTTRDMGSAVASRISKRRGGVVSRIKRIASRFDPSINFVKEFKENDTLL